MESEEAVDMSDFDYLGHDWEGSLPELPRDLDFFRTSLRLLKELEAEDVRNPDLPHAPWDSNFQVPIMVDDDDNVLATMDLPGPVDLLVGTKFAYLADGGRNAQRMTRFSEHLFADYLGDVGKEVIGQLLEKDVDVGRAAISGMLFTSRDLILLDFYKSLGLPGGIVTKDMDYKILQDRRLPTYLRGVPEIEHRSRYVNLSEMEKQHVMDMFFYALSFYLGYPDPADD
jgi:hypothetical protein